jgi:16S rRNA (uracil1498-N3)-methyltransferase
MVAARRFFVEGTQSVGNVVEIAGGDAHRVAHVLRLRRGDRIEVIDSTATAFTATIEATGDVVRASLVRAVPDSSPRDSVHVEVAQAVPKGQRMDFVVEKGTELGATGFLPFYCERSVTRTIGKEKLARWRRLARASAQQSGRREVPAIREPLQFEGLLGAFDSYDAVLFAWELAAPLSLSETLAAALPRCGRVLVVVGPEGGFTHAEAEAAQLRGATLLSLGPRILRTDTAAVALLAVIGAWTS